jgi:hypothetical protein
MPFQIAATWLLAALPGPPRSLIVSVLRQSTTRFLSRRDTTATRLSRRPLAA